MSSTVPFYGIWNVEEFTQDGMSRPPVVVDDARWRQVVFDYADWHDCCDSYYGFVVMTTDLKRWAYWMQFSAANRQLEVMKIDPYERRYPNPPFRATGHFGTETSSPDRMVLNGELDGHRIRVVLLRAKVDFRLQQRGFQWTSLTHGFE